MLISYFGLNIIFPDGNTDSLNTIIKKGYIDNIGYISPSDISVSGVYPTYRLNITNADNELYGKSIDVVLIVKDSSSLLTSKQLSPTVLLSKNIIGKTYTLEELSSLTIDKIKKSSNISIQKLSYLLIELIKQASRL